MSEGTTINREQQRRRGSPDGWLRRRQIGIRLRAAPQQCIGSYKQWDRCGGPTATNS